MSTEHRVWVRGRGLGRYPDPDTSTDPRVVAVLDKLRAQEPPAPRAHFRAELRAQLVAVAPRLIAEGEPAQAAPVIDLAPARGVVAERPRPTPRPSPGPRVTRTSRDTFWQKVREIPIGRPLAVAASVIAVFAMLLGGAVYMSQDSVPGDTLYGLKRASENVRLDLASNDSERARYHLEFAAERVDEARDLISRASASAAGTGPLADGRLAEQAENLISQTLDSADDDTRTASQLLGDEAVKSGSSSALSPLTSWAPQQLARLSRLRDALPRDSRISTAAASSADLVHAASTRADTLKKWVSCKCLTKEHDALGPLPIPLKNTQQPPVTPPATSSSPTKRSTPSSAPTRSTPSTAAPRTSNRPSTSGSSSSKAPGLHLPPITVPTVPAPTTGKPLIDLCKINLLGIKLCPSPSP